MSGGINIIGHMLKTTCLKPAWSWQKVLMGPDDLDKVVVVKTVDIL